jgi:hypothetical protein
MILYSCSHTWDRHGEVRIPTERTRTPSTAEIVPQVQQSVLLYRYKPERLRSAGPMKCDQITQVFSEMGKCIMSLTVLASSIS